MAANTDYPRMLFHRTKDPVTVQTREQEDALGREWSRVIWPPAEEPVRESEPEPEPEPEPELEPAGGPAHQVEALHRAVRARSNAPVKTAKKKR